MEMSVRTVLCGIGGFGEWYLRNFWQERGSLLDFAGFVDPAPERSRFFERIRAAGTPVYPSLQAFYERDGADLAIVSSPIQFHCPQTLCALAHGSHVLCEKPLCATVGEGRLMRDAQQRSGRLVAIGYQMSFAESTQRLKADISAGVWGRPLLLKCLARLPRSRSYYTRNSWAGRVKDAQGRWVLDSPVNNAAAHSLHHMLYLLGDAPARSALPERVQAGLYRAHAIENYDTAFLRCTVAGGAEIFFAVSHACARDGRTEFSFAFENGTIECCESGEVTGRLANGTLRIYAKGPLDDRRKVLDTVAAIVEGREASCGIEAALSHTMCVNAAQQSGMPVVDLSPEIVGETKLKNETYITVRGLDDVLRASYRTAALPDASIAAWARPGRVVADVSANCYFQ